MLDLLRCCVVVLLAIGVSYASITSKCPQLLPVPSDSSPALLMGTVEVVLTADEDGKYGVVLLLQQIISGQDAMINVLSSQRGLQT